jgi:hypothetical protein
MELIPIESLKIDAIHTQPIYYDLTKHKHEYNFAYKRKKDYKEKILKRPYTNWIYHIPKLELTTENKEEFKEIFGKQLPLELIQWITGKEYFLTLHAGGMDMSWDIALAYILLGYCPPLEFCRLPNNTEVDLTNKITQHIVMACNKSLKVTENQCKITKDELNFLYLNKMKQLGVIDETD